MIKVKKTIKGKTIIFPLRTILAQDGLEVASKTPTLFHPFDFEAIRVFGGHCLQCLKTYVLSIRLVTIRLPTFRFSYPSILNANTCL